MRLNYFKVAEEKIDTLVTTMIICMFLGARLTYVFIYNWDYYGSNLTEIFSFWHGGLSFHGALVGLIAGGVLFARREKISWLQVMDCVALAGTQGIFFGRIGNFINGELYGRITSSPIGMVFPSGGPMPRHPSQLYEAFLEGIVLSLLLWLTFKKVKQYGVLSSLFLLGYGVARFIVEFFREPDQQLGFYFGSLTMGQLLCSLMILGGVGLYVYVKKHEASLRL